MSDSRVESERDFAGYGADPPDPKWPSGARVALQFVLNYEEGAERCVLDGDDGSEAYLTETPGAALLSGERSLTSESIYEFGARVGVWRIMRQFSDRSLPFTMFAAGLALERNPAVAEAAAALGCDFAGHGYRWIDYAAVDEATEREHIARTVDVITRLAGRRPIGWYTGRTSVRTRPLIREHGGFLYDSDSYSDELPYWIGDHLVVPYSFDANDAKFAGYNGFATGEQFADYLRASLDLLLEEGERRPRMMSVGLHPRLIGRPGRAAAFAAFLDYAKARPGVWICRREDIARHWRAVHPPLVQLRSTPTDPEPSARARAEQQIAPTGARSAST